MSISTFEQATLSGDEFNRYSRQIMLSNWGETGQLQLKVSKVAIVGCGGLGNVVASYLAGAGIGYITLIDGDKVELSNLPRQFAFEINSCEQNKAEELSFRLNQQNDEISIQAYPDFLNKDNISTLLSDHNLVLDCSDNFTSRYLLNQWCVQQSIALLSASVIGWQGQLLLVNNTSKHGCYQCLFEQAPTQQQNCHSLGVNPAMVGIIGSYQASQALSFLLGLKTPLAEHVMLVDGINLTVSHLQRSANDHCPICNSTNNQLEQ